MQNNNNYNNINSYDNNNKRHPSPLNDILYPRTNKKRKNTLNNNLDDVKLYIML